MIRVLRSEWVRIRRRRLLWGTIAATALLVALATATTFLTASSTATAGPAGPGPASSTPGELAAADGVVAGLTAAGNLLGVVALAVFAFGVASEETLGTWRVLLVREPRRLLLLGGKLLAHVGFAALLATVATVVAALGALALGPGQGVDTTAWSAGALVGGWLGAVALMSGYGVLGALLGLLLRSPVPAIAVGVAWALPVETILRGVSPDVDAWLPGRVLDAVLHGGTAEVGLARASVTAALYVAAACVTMGIVFRRRDVTA